jgi:hypothetical protein
MCLLESTTYKLRVPEACIRVPELEAPKFVIFTS